MITLILALLAWLGLIFMAHWLLDQSARIEVLEEKIRRHSVDG